ncbi:MAG: TetR/AcrR family transcriptional regulator [Myxococcota bacterium]|nr:TetR/AcrR family transcriptional regulator [Myxococcota bacterium]
MRRQILDATEALLLEAGYDGFSIRKLVVRCGYTAPTIYHHFGDKPGLIDALLEERFRILHDQIRRVDTQAAPEDQLRQMGLAVIGFARSHPAHYRLLSLPRDPDWAPPQSWEESRAAFERPVDELFGAGRILAGDREAAGQALWCLLHGIASLRNAHPEGEWSPTLDEDAIDALLRGLITPPAEAHPQGGRGGRR